MSITLTLGWWLAPVLLSIALVVWALVDRPHEHGGFIPHPGPFIRLVGATILGLMSWVVYLGLALVLRV